MNARPLDFAWRADLNCSYSEFVTMSAPSLESTCPVFYGGGVMPIDYTGRQVEISTDLRRYTQERLRKIVRLLGGRV